MFSTVVASFVMEKDKDKDKNFLFFKITKNKKIIKSLKYGPSQALY